MRAGRLRHYLRVMRKTTTENTYGEPEDSWNQVYDMRAEIMVLRGSQLEAAQKINESVQYKIRARYTDQVEAQDRLESEDGTSYEIMALTSDPNGRPRDLEAMCRIVTASNSTV